MESYYIIYKGQSMSDVYMAQVAFYNAKFDAVNITHLVDCYFDWLLENCTNVNEVNLYNVVVQLLWDWHDTFNDTLDKYIQSKVEALAAKGKIKTW